MRYNSTPHASRLRSLLPGGFHRLRGWLGYFAHDALQRLKTTYSQNDDEIFAITGQRPRGTVLAALAIPSKAHPLELGSKS